MTQDFPKLTFRCRDMNLDLRAWLGECYEGKGKITTIETVLVHHLSSRVCDSLASVKYLLANAQTPQQIAKKALAATVLLVMEDE